MKRSELVAGEHYAVWHPAEKDKKNAVKVKVLSTEGVYQNAEGTYVWTHDQGQGVLVQWVSDSDAAEPADEIIRLQLLRQTWADYEAGKEVAKWEYQPKDTEASYKQALRRLRDHPETPDSLRERLVWELDRFDVPAEAS